MKLDRSIRLWMKRLALEVHAHAVSWVAAANVRQEYITTVVRSTVVKFNKHEILA